MEFDLGSKAAKNDSANLAFAFVDLQGTSDLGTSPNVYVIPSAWIVNHCAAWVDEKTRVMLHAELEVVQPFKNDYTPLLEALEMHEPQPV